MAQTSLTPGHHRHAPFWIAVVLVATILGSTGVKTDSPPKVSGAHQPLLTQVSPRSRTGVAGASRIVRRTVVSPGVGLLVFLQTQPPQRIAVMSVATWAHVRVALVSAGSPSFPFATVSASVARHGALAGTNGYFTTKVPLSPMLVRDGSIVAAACVPPGCVSDPRTGFGLTSDGTALLVTVDGRQRGATGMTLRGFAALMLKLGAVWAVNLDGGASTTMVVNSRVINRPSDRNRERPVRTVIVLVPSSGIGVRALLRRLRELDRRVVPPAMPAG